MSRLSGLYWTGSVTFGNPAATAQVNNSVTVPGAKVGDFVLVSLELAAGTADDCVVYGQVTADDTVQIGIQADDTGATIGATTTHVKVIPKDAI